MPRRAAAPNHIYQLKISLRDSKPPIWRRIEVADTTTLAQLHQIVQAIMGWYDYHLHQFELGQVSYGVPDPDYFHEVRDERRFKLNQLISEPKQKLSYEYDFGDSWDHTILLEKVLAPKPGVVYPRCTAGRRACPPEDVGGIWGYEAFLEAISDPAHPQHAELREWAGDEFDPEVFDLAAINAALQAIA
ncbi:hypothetical protein SE17_06340 [Kouleothrix aurantiaca]|uniref:Plasmid pRiA4b Orf3-like domain-containing protein n=1 Tax=Kouleothrix aurantiaca TaxID=186479 RepID=A0A0P9DE91_9CHLR|nr:hypothetical protein SE17_06340 [Kouleothrix aurantiaca]